MQSFVTHNQEPIDITDTHLIGYIRTTRASLTLVLGNPELEADSKVTTQWYIRFEDGTVLTVYDWKMDRPPQGVYQWHIGGHKEADVDKLRGLFPGTTITQGW